MVNVILPEGTPLYTLHSAAPKGYGFLAVLVWNGKLILAILGWVCSLVLNWVRFF